MREGFLRLGISCTNCGKELAAKRARSRSSISISGMMDLEYIHVDTQISTCTRVYDASPYDVFVATRAFEEARAHLDRMKP